MESIHVSFDDKRIMGLADMDDHEELHFENEEIFSDPTNSDPTNSDEQSNSDFEQNADSNTDSTDSGGATVHTEAAQQNQESMDQAGGSNDEGSQLPHARKWTKSHTPDLIIGNPEAGVQTRTATANECLHHCFLS